MTKLDLFRAADADVRAALPHLEARIEREWAKRLRGAARALALALLKEASLSAAAPRPSWHVPPRSVIAASFDRYLASLPKPKASVNVATSYLDGVASTLGVQFDHADPLIAGVIARHSGTRITGHTDAWIGEAMTNLQESFDAGLSLPHASTALRTRLGEVTQYAAKRIAATEFAGATNGASLASATLLDVARNKVWVTAGDSHVRDSHMAIDGETIPLDDTFSNGCDHPGDPNGPAEEVIFCRCVLDYTDDSMTAAGAAVYTRPKKEDGMAPVAAPTETAAPVKWRSILAVEGVETSDERKLAPDSVTWRELPLTLMAQITTADGHDEARVVGRIDAIERQGANIVGEGEFVTDEFGTQVAGWVGDGTLRGVSIDLAVDDFEIEPYEDAPAEQDDLADLFGPPGVMVVTKGTIMGATITPFPAFAEASIMLASAVVEDRRRHVLRIGSTISLLGADGEELAFPPAAPAPAKPPAATGSPDADKIIADLKDVAADYDGTDGQIVVTIDGNATTIKFPPAGTPDPDQAEDDKGLASAAQALTAAAVALTAALERRPRR